MLLYGQVNSLRLKSSVASKWASKTFGDNIFLFAGDVIFIKNLHLLNPDENKFEFALIN